jgi:hypothetical protein
MLCHGLLKSLQTIQQTNILLLYMDSQELNFPKRKTQVLWTFSLFRTAVTVFTSFKIMTLLTVQETTRSELLPLTQHT